MDYFSIGFNGACLIMQSVLHIVFISRLAGKQEKIWHIVMYFFLMCGMEGLCWKFAFIGDLAFGGQMLILYGISRFNFKNRRSVSCTGAVLAIYISQLSSGMVNSVQGLIFPKVVGSIWLYFMLVITTGITFCICAACYRAVLLLFPEEEERQTPYIGLLLLPGLFFFAAELYLLRTSYSNVSFSVSTAECGKQLMLLSLQVMGLAALLSTLYAYRQVCRGLKAQTAFHSLAQEIKAQKKYISEAQMRYDRTKSFRHDIKNHLSVLDGLLNSGKMEEAKDYLKKMETASYALSFPYQTGNPVVDILLGEKLGPAKISGIRADVSLIFPKPCGIDDFDLCVIFANALDNAVFACRSVREEKFIRIFGEGQGDFYMLGFENSCAEGPLPAMGTGLLNIKAVAEKYHGAVITEKTDTRFTLNVLLDIS